MTAYVGNPHDSPIWEQIADERERQEEIGRRKRAEGIDWRSCADPAMPGGDDRRAAVLGEEYGEACRAVLEAAAMVGNTSYLAAGLRVALEGDLRRELVQVAAVAVAWIEAIDARARR